MSVVSRARELRRSIEATSSTLSDEAAVRVVELFPQYNENHEYQTGDRFRVGGYLYKRINYGDSGNVNILCR